MKKSQARNNERMKLHSLPALKNYMAHKTYTLHANVLSNWKKDKENLHFPMATARTIFQGGGGQSLKLPQISFVVQRCHGKFEAIIVRVIDEEPQMVEIRFLVTEGPYPDGELETLHD